MWGNIYLDEDEDEDDIEVVPLDLNYDDEGMYTHDFMSSLFGVENDNDSSACMYEPDQLDYDEDKWD